MSILEEFPATLDLVPTLRSYPRVDDFQLERLEERVVLDAIPLGGLDAMEVVSEEPVSEWESLQTESPAAESTGVATTGSQGLFEELPSAPLLDGNSVESETLTSPSPGTSVSSEADEEMDGQNSLGLGLEAIVSGDPTNSLTEYLAEQVGTAERLTGSLYSAQGPPTESEMLNDHSRGTVPSKHSQDPPSLQPQATQPVRPLILLPGIGGNFAATGFIDEWYVRRGIEPEKLQIDPLVGVYDDLIKTLLNAGYVEGQSLFVGNYDWRMTPGPDDGLVDGKLSGLTATSITDTTYEYGVDYLGYYLKRATDAWTTTHGQAPVDVDLVVHSTGGLVARAYIQSDAYGGRTGNLTLPKVHDLLMLGVPNRGASKAWNPLHDDWDVEVAFRVVLSKILARAWDRLQSGETISGPDGNMTREQINAAANPKIEFALKYVPTMRGLLATYDFLDRGQKDGQGNVVYENVNQSSTDRNSILLDLNDGLDFLYSITQLNNSANHTVTLNGRQRDPNAFIDRLNGDLVVLYSAGQTTPTKTRTRIGASALGDEILTFTNFYGRVPNPGETWYQPIPEDNGGDGTVPLVSSLGQFEKDTNARIKKHSLTVKDDREALDHLGIVWNAASQKIVLQELGIPFTEQTLSKYSAAGDIESITRVLSLGVLRPDELVKDRALDALVKDGLKVGLDTLRTFASRLDQVGFMAERIPVLDRSMGSILNFGNLISVFTQPIIDAVASPAVTQLTQLVQRIRDWVAQTKNDPNVSRVLEVLTEAHRIVGGLVSLSDPDLAKALGLPVSQANPAYAEILIQIPLHARRTVELQLDLGNEAAAAGVSAGLGIRVNAVVEAKLELTLGFDMGSGVSADRRFFVRFGNFQATAALNVPNLNASINVGILGADVVQGRAQLSAGLYGIVANPDGDARRNLSLAELNEFQNNNFLTFQRRGSMEASLPLRARIGDVQLPGNPTLALVATDLFDGRGPRVNFNTDFNRWLDFTALSAGDVLGLMEQFCDWLGTLRNSSLLSTPIPYAKGTTIGTLLDLKQPLLELVNALRGQENRASFENLQQLTNRITQALGLPNDSLKPVYDPQARTLLLRLTLGAAISKSISFDDSTQLGPVASFSGRAQELAAAGSLSLQLGIGFDLRPSVAVLQARSALAASGVLARDVRFLLRVGSGAPRVLTLLSSSTTGGGGQPANQSRADLVADLNALFSKEGLQSLVNAQLNGDRLELRTTGAGQNAYLRVEADGANANLDLLGFTSGQEAYQPSDSRLFLTQDSRLGGSATLTIQDLNLSAIFGGVVEVGVVGGSGSVQATLQVSLMDPGASQDGRITLAEILGAQSIDRVVTASIGGSATVRLPLVMNPPILNAPSTGPPAVLIAWPDFTRPDTLQIRTENIDLIAGLSALKDQAISLALGQLRQYLIALQSTALNTPLPLIGKSVLEILGFVEDITRRVQEFQNRPEQTLQFIERKLEEIFQLPDSAVSLGLDGSTTLKISMRLEKSVRISLPFDLDLSTLVAQLPTNDPARQFLSEITRLIQVSGSGLVSVQAGALMQVDLGIEFSTPAGAQAPTVRAFLYDTTRLQLTAGAAVNQLSFSAAAGPIALEIVQGTAKIGRSCDANDNAPAEFVAGLKRDITDGRYYFDSDLGTEDLELVLTAGICATLPLEIQVLRTRESLGNLSFQINRFADFINGRPNSLVLTTPDLRGKASNFDFADNLELIIDGVDYLLSQIQDGLQSNVFNVRLPVIGTGLADASREGVRFIDFLRTRILTELRAAFANATTRGVALVRSAMFAAVGPTGLNILADLNGDGAVNLADVEAITTSSAGLVNQVQFNLLLRKPVEIFRGAVRFDAGVPALKLEIDGGIDLALDFELALRFGVNRQHGFYLDTSVTNELKARFIASMPGLKASGRLGFLQLDVADSSVKPSRMEVRFDVDIKDPFPGTSAAEKDRLTFNDLIRASFDNVLSAKFSGEADIRLSLVTSFGGDAQFPSLATDFELKWKVTSDDNFELRPPSIAFTNVRLNMGEFIARYMSGILKRIQEIIEPIRPVIEFLEQPVPGISELLGRPYKVVNLLVDGGVGGGNEGIEKFVTQFVGFAGLVNQMNGFSDPKNLWISLGSFGFGNTDVRTVQDLAAYLQQTEILQSVRERLPGLNLRVAELVEELSDIADTGSGFKFPVFEDPTRAFQLLLGKDVSLIEYRMAPLVFERKFEKAIPLVGPVVAYISGNFKMEGRLAFGYDTRGIRQFIESRNGFDLLNGLFMADRDDTGRDRNEFTLEANLRVGVKAEAGAGRIGAEGGINGIGFLDLRDPDNDGRVHVDEFIENLSAGSDLAKKFVCTFNLGGTVDAYFRAFAEIGVCPICIGPEFKVNKVLFDFATTDDDCLKDLFPDRFEDFGVDRNGTRETATPLGLGPGQWINRVAIGAPGDIDFYTFELARAEDVQIRLPFKRTRGDLTATVTDVKGRLIGRSQDVRNSGFEGDIAHLGVLQPGVYWIQVRGPTVANEYTVHIAPGTQSETRVFYINDSTVTNPYYTAVAGKDTADGLSPQTPKSSLAAIAATYDLNSTDVLVMDTGAFTGSLTLDAEDDGFLLTGSIGGTKWDFSATALRFQGSGGNYIHGLQFIGSGAGATAIDFGQGSNRHIVRNVKFDRGTVAIRLAGGSLEAFDNMLTNVTTVGFDLLGNSTGTLHDNTLQMASGIGIRVDTTLAATLTIESNRISNTDTAGIQVRGQASVLLKNNVITARIGAGIEFTSTNAIVAEENSVSQVTSHGFLIQGASGATLRNNRIELVSGIALKIGISGEFIAEDNALLGGSTHGIWIAAAASSRLVRNELSIRSNAIGILVESGSTRIEFNDVSGSGASSLQIAANASLSSAVRSNTFRATVTDGIRFESREPGVIELNDIGPASRYGIVSPTNAPLNLRANTIRLAGSATGIGLDQGNHRIDDNTISGSGTAGILLGASANAPIINNTINLTGARLGIRLQTDQEARVEGNNVGVTSEFGIHLPNASRSTVRNNRVTTSGSTAIAIRFERGTGQIDNNTTNGSGQYAIYLSAAVKLQDATIRGNRLETSASHSALRLESPDPVLIEGNTIAGALTYGIYLPSSTRATIRNNTIQTGYNGLPIRLETGEHLIEGNRITADGASVPAMLLTGTARGTIRGNTVQGGPVRVTFGENRIEQNRITGSRDGFNVQFELTAFGQVVDNVLSGAGLRVQGAVPILVTGNRILNAGIGIHLVAPTTATIRGNQILLTQNGIRVGAGRLVVEDNVIEYTNSFALEYNNLQSNALIEVRRNTIRAGSQSSGRAMELRNGGPVFVEDNTITGLPNGLFATSLDILRIRRNEIKTLATGIFASAPDQILEDNQVSTLPSTLKSGRGIEIEFASTGRTAIIRNNDISGFQVGLWCTTTRVGIYGNRIHGNLTGISFRATVGVAGESPNLIFDNDVGVDGSDQTVVHFNRIFHNRIGVRGHGGRGLIAANVIYGNTEVGVLIANTIYQVLSNTIDAATGSAIALRDFAGNVVLRNNLLSVGNAIAFDISIPSLNTTVADFNLIELREANSRTGSFRGTASRTLTEWQAATKFDANSVTADPRFKNRATGDYSLLAGSPAIDRGDAWYSPRLPLADGGRWDEPTTPNAGRPDYVLSTSTASDFALTGTSRNWRGNGTYWGASLPFSMPYFDQTISFINVSSEGFIALNSSQIYRDGDNTTAKLLSNAIIAPLWDNLRTDGVGDDIYWDTTQADRLTIRWNATHEPSGADVQFAVTLFRDGRIQFHYGSGNTGLTPTIGFSSGSGMAYQLSPYDGASALTNAHSTAFVLHPSFVDIGASEFRDSATIGSGTQRSFVTSISLAIPTPAGKPLTIDQILVRNVLTGSIIPAGNLQLTYDNTLQIARISSTGLPNGSFPEGRYELVIPASVINGPTGSVVSRDVVVNWLVLKGDATGDGVVNERDLARVANELRRPANQRSLDLDLNGDRRVDDADLAFVRTNYLRSLPPAPGSSDVQGKLARAELYRSFNSHKLRRQ